MGVKVVHRYVSLVFAALWLFQAATGVLIVFRWELDDASISAPSVPFDAAAMGERLDAMARAPNIKISSVWSSGAGADRYDIFYEDNDHSRTLRVDGHGQPLRDRSNEDLGNGNIYDRLSDLHMALMLGDVGRWFIGFSGILLITNLILGLKMAWPRAGQWLKAMQPPKGKASMAITYGWHRMLGLWLAFPALLTLAAGAVLAFDDPLAGLFKADVPQPAATSSPAPSSMPPSRALARALEAYPGATISGVSFPGENNWYRIRLHARGEMPRIWGMTTVYISSQDGSILSAYDARQAHAPMRFMLDVAYPLHTGQIGGVLGRVLQLVIGVWLAAMIGLGLSLWWIRRRLNKRA